MRKKALILDSITRQGILPLFYDDNAEVSIQTLRALYDGGVRVVEYTNRGSQAMPNFLALKKLQQSELTDLRLGIGTIKNGPEAEAFAAAGADFLVSPVVSSAVAAVAAAHELLWIPGCMTPTEINAAIGLEAPLVKVFPANILGQDFIKAVRELFPGTLFMPTGGVDLTHESIGGWFQAGVCAVGLGSRLISKELLRSADYTKLREETENVLAIVKQVNNVLTG